MSDVSSLMMNLSLMQSALSSASSISSANTAKLNQSVNIQQSSGSKEQGVYAVEGDPLYKEEMDTDSDGIVTNQEMASYYAKIASDYGGSVPSFGNTTGNVVNATQGANAYKLADMNFSAPYTSLIESEA